MIQRLLKPSKSSSFFIFGARGTGKSTFIQNQFQMKSPWTIDLLDPEVEDYYARSPKRLEQEYLQKMKKPDWVVIDEVQKVPRILDVVHRMIENQKVKFILTGSSARKLKRGAANLLAGRAFVYNLYPLTSLELNLKQADEQSLIEYLHWGGLPKLTELHNEPDKIKYLRSYTLTYLNEEIRAEQILRKLEPFRAFLEIAAQQNGKIINHSKIASEVQVDTKTVQSYFQVLEDTLIGFYLPAFHLSVRKSQKLNPKFYLQDLGMKKALEGSLLQRPLPRTSVFGELFESMVLLDIYRLSHYFEQDCRFSYFSTKNGVEVDLVLTRGRENTLIEIKSTTTIDESEVRGLAKIAKDFPRLKEVFYLSRDSHSIKVDGVQCMHWLDFLNKMQR